MHYINEISDEDSFRLTVSSHLAPDPYAIYLLSVTLAYATQMMELQNRHQRRMGRIMLFTLIVLGVLIAVDMGDIVGRLIHSLKG